LLGVLLSDVGAGAESPLELTYLWDVERAHGLPVGRRQASRLGLPYASDVSYDAFGLLVELDGRLGHDGAARFRDMQRDNRFSSRGWPPSATAGSTWSTTRASLRRRWRRSSWIRAGRAFPGAAAVVPPHRRSSCGSLPERLLVVTRG
jgi:hypothetical protein